MEREKCNRQAVFRYTWPGQDESFCCVGHGQGIQAVAQAIGSHLQLIPLPDDTEEMCQNEEPAANRQEG